MFSIKGRNVAYLNKVRIKPNFQSQKMSQQTSASPPKVSFFLRIKHQVKKKENKKRNKLNKSKNKAWRNYEIVHNSIFIYSSFISPKQTGVILSKYVLALKKSGLASRNIVHNHLSHSTLDRSLLLYPLFSILILRLRIRSPV